MQTWVKAIPLATFSSASLTTNYQSINGPGGLPHPCFLLKIVNGGSTAITISYDGINDHEYLLTNTSFPINTQTNSEPNAREAIFAARTQIWVKGTAGTGTIALSGYYV
jgi:hypothetical protein